MQVIFYDKTVKGKAVVQTIHYKPELLDQSTLNLGLVVERIPEPVPQDKKDAILVIDTQSKELSYEYVNRPLTTEEKLELSLQQNEMLSQRQTTTEEAISFLLGL